MMVHAFGGLCNRLRVVLSYYAAGEREFIWMPDGEVAEARFEDVFVPLLDARFYDSGTSDISTLDENPIAPAGWKELYRSLHLRSEHLQALADVGLPLTYSAMHVRRTDHVTLAQSEGQFTGDDVFMRWLGGTLSDVYIATDSEASQSQWSNLAYVSGRRAYYAKPLHSNYDDGGRRNSSLACAAVDMFACAGAARFQGSGASSFTNTIQLLRSMGGWWGPAQCQL